MSLFEIAVLGLLVLILVLVMVATRILGMLGKDLQRIEDVNAARYRSLLDELINGGEASVEFRERTLMEMRDGGLSKSRWDDARNCYRGEE